MKKISFILLTCLMLIFGVTISIDRLKTIDSVDASSQTIDNMFTPYNLRFTNNWLQYNAAFQFPNTSLSCWTDGTYIYFSYGSSQYVLDNSTSTWSTKTWTGLSIFNGAYIWTDGTYIYNSNTSNQYVLDIATSTWSTKTWTGLSSFDGSNVWTDGTNIYYSNNFTHYVLDIATSTWSTKTWTGLSDFYGSRIWTDGTNIYYSNGSYQYVLDIATSTWSTKTWSGFSYLYGSSVWTDGTNIYYSSSSEQLVLDIATSTWSTKTWTGYIPTSGSNIFVFNDIIIIPSSNSSSWYMLEKDTSSGGGDNTDTYYHFTGSSFNLLAFADSTNYIVGNHFIDIQDVSTTQFDITFNADILTAVNGNNSLSYSVGSSLSLSFRYNLNTSYSNADFFHSQTFPFHINVTTSTWSDSNIVGCSISTILGVVSTQTNTGTWIDNYGLVQYNFSYFNSSNERLNIIVAGIYDRTILQTMPLVLSSRTYYFNSDGSGGSFQEGYDQGYYDGLDVGYNNGYNAAQYSSYNDGYRDGFSIGSSNGYDLGYDDGYLDGAADTNDYTFFSLISATVDAPLQAFTNLFNFDFFGFNLLNIFTGLLTLVVLIAVLRFLMGGK